MSALGKAVNTELLKGLAKLSLRTEEMAFVLGVDESEILKHSKLIKDAWPSDQDFIKTRIRRIKRNSSLYSDKKLGAISQALRMHLADMVIREIGGFEHLFGYKVIDLVADFESKFRDGMSWENWGEWHIDHIKPRRLYKSVQSKECFALTNLQPLWKADNYKKGSKYDG